MSHGSDASSDHSQDNLQETFSDWDELEDDDFEQSGMIIKSFFSDETFLTIEELIEFDCKSFNFDLIEIMSKSVLRQSHSGKVTCLMEDVICLINFIRAKFLQFHQGNKDFDITVFVDSLRREIYTKSFLQDEENMRAVLCRDFLLYRLRNFFLNKIRDSGDDDDERDEDANDKIEMSKDNLMLLQQYKDLVTTLTTDVDDMNKSTIEYPESGYFESCYGHYSIHETMLRDEVRTNAYCDAFKCNTAYIKDKIVLDIGTGSGILAMFAAKFGAKKVIGVDNSSFINHTKRIIKRNKLDGVISLVQGQIEDSTTQKQIYEILEGAQVDIIVSEWMGYGCYFENMLPSVLLARDMFLKNSGLLMPSHSNLFIEVIDPCSNNSLSGESYDRVRYWEDVYGFDMSDITELLTSEAQVELTSSCDTTSNRFLLHSLDLFRLNDNELDFTLPFSLTLQRDSALRAFVITFDVLFQCKVFAHWTNICMSTSTQEPETHWKQCVLWVKAEYIENFKIGTTISGTLQYQRRRHFNQNRQYDITVSWNRLDDHGNIEMRSQTFILH